MYCGINNRTKLLLLSIIAIATLTHCDREDPEITDFAYPPEDMLRYYDFPEGSWWAYLCINDSTVDTFRLIQRNAPGRLKKDRYSDGAYYKGAGFQFYHNNENKLFSLDSFGIGLNPIGEINPENEKNHKFFVSIVAPHHGQFNPFYELYYPLSDSSYFENPNNYSIISDTLIQGNSYQNVLQSRDIWEQPTIPIFITEKFLVQDIGVIKYSLNNGFSYELIQYSIN